MVSSVSKRMSISAWPAVPTSWCCTSISMPTSSSIFTISERRSCAWSIGGTGKYPSLYRGLYPRFGEPSSSYSRPEFHTPSVESRK